MQGLFREIGLRTGEGISVHDLTARVRETVAESGVREGMVVVSTPHTTCAVSVNENEERLLMDIAAFFPELVPPNRAWKHNDLHLRRDIPPDEPKNAHSHLIAMMIGHSATLAVHEGAPVLGRYQAVLMLELDGPRDRRCHIQVLGR
jgi:secondary thiamine-phosphate synthase enzyme